MFLTVLLLDVIPVMRYNSTLQTVDCIYLGSVVEPIECSSDQDTKSCWVGLEIFSFCFEGAQRNGTLEATARDDSREVAEDSLERRLREDHRGLTEGDSVHCHVNPEGELVDKKDNFVDLVIVILTGIFSLYSGCFVCFPFFVGTLVLIHNHCCKNKYKKEMYELFEMGEK